MDDDSNNHIQKLQREEPILRRIYGEVRTVLAEHVFDVDLDPPDSISFEKMIATLKAILSHQPGDKIKMEKSYPIPFCEGQSVGAYIQEQLGLSGLSYIDLYYAVLELNQLEDDSE